MKQQLIGLFIRGLAIITCDLDVQTVGDDPAFHRLDPLQDVIGDRHCIGTCALGKSQRYSGTADDFATGITRQGGDMLFIKISDEGDIGNVADIHGTPIPCGQLQIADLVRGRQCLADDQTDLFAGIALQSGGRSTVGARNLCCQLL